MHPGRNLREPIFPSDKNHLNDRMHKVLLMGILSCAFLLAAAGMRSQTGLGTTVQARFEDVAAHAGLTARMVNGGEKIKKYIWESTGSGIAAIDYDRDGFPDLFIVNGTTLEGFPQGSEPTNHLYHNNRDGTFTDVTRRAGLEHSGWGHGVCVGDYDNDGLDDLTGDGYAAHVAGAIGVSTDAQASWWGGKGIGTVPHGLIAACGGDTVEAARRFADPYYPDVNVVALVDFDNDCVGTSLACARALGRAPVGRPSGHGGEHGRRRLGR